MPVAAGSAGPLYLSGVGGLATHGLVLAVVLIAFVALPILPAMQDARSEPRPAETASVVEETPEPTAKATGETRESAYEKLALNKLTIEREAPKNRRPPRSPNGSRRRRSRSATCERGRRASTCSPDRRERLPGRNLPPRNLPNGNLPSGRPPFKEPPRAKLPTLVRRRSAKGANRTTRGCCSRYLGWGSRT
jgi:hypothetical protein